jgi:hypothetical protein
MRNTGIHVGGTDLRTTLELRGLPPHSIYNAVDEPEVSHTAAGTGL